MFCANCGEKLSGENIKFCPNCGTTVTAKHESTQPTHTRTFDTIGRPKTNGKKNLVICLCIVLILAVALAAVLILNNTGGRLSGTWEEATTIAGAAGFRSSITFRGNSFTSSQAYIFNHRIGWSPVFRGLFSSDYHHYDWRYSEFEPLDEDHSYARFEITGTFSLTDDGRIEFVLSNGVIVVRSFSQTENTMLIGGRQFIRR